MKITLYETPLNNHGCNGEWLELEILNSKEAVVVAGGSCSSCWQVGHDKNEPRFPVGTKVCLPSQFRDTKVWNALGPYTHVSSGDGYFNGNEVPATWQNAKMLAGFCHNELVDDLDYPQPDTTLLRPSDLMVSLSNF